MIMKTGGIGIAIDDNCALEIIENQFRVFASKAYAKAYLVYKKSGKVVSRKIRQKSGFASIASLYAGVTEETRN